MRENPFKFGTVVDGIYFTDREEEVSEITSYLKSEYHLIIISPRRFGKTSLIRKVLTESDRKHIYLDLQVVLSEEDFAAQLCDILARATDFTAVITDRPLDAKWHEALRSKGCSIIDDDRETSTPELLG